jgi:replication factor C subunit 2/4
MSRTNDISSRSTQRPWIELYRPNTLDDIILQPMERKFLERIREDAPKVSDSDTAHVSRNMPGLIICGPPGTGKTTTLICLAMHALGSHYEDGLIELNSSNDRGITAIESLMVFCKKSSTYVNQSGKTCTFQKIIIFDEADRITDKAQMAIADLMNKYPNVAFTFTCNDSTLIVADIQSKCSILRYNQIERKVMAERLITICNKHGAKWSQKGIDEAVMDANGDMRKAINIAQSVWSGFGEITPTNIRKLHPRPSSDTINIIFKYCKKGQLNQALEILHLMQSEGSSSQDILMSMQNFLNVDQEFEPIFRMRCIGALGKGMYASSTFQTSLQLDACIASICSPVLEKKNKA